jgi:molybdate transport system substrate-binding protein
MFRYLSMFRYLLALSLTVVAGVCDAAEPLRVAVASSFENTFESLRAAYAKQASVQIEATYASTNALYLQIVSGTPFAALFAADSVRTEKLVGEGRAKATSRFVYAIGRLALWTPGAGAPPPSAWLEDPTHRVALSDPGNSAYGLAAKQTLTSMKLWDAVQARIIIANGDDDTMKAIESKSAPGGFVPFGALLVYYKGKPPTDDAWMVPQTMYEPIVQEAVVLDGQDAARAQNFLTFVASDAGRAIVSADGYAVLASVP